MTDSAIPSPAQAEPADLGAAESPKAPLKAPRVAGRPPAAPGDPSPGAGAGLPLTHEREESVGDVAPEPDPVIQQAHKDLAEGQVDTDLRNQPGVDAERQADVLQRGDR